jgi:hypothetical protein
MLVEILVLIFHYDLLEDLMGRGTTPAVCLRLVATLLVQGLFGPTLFVSEGLGVLLVCAHIPRGHSTNTIEVDPV